MTIQFDWDQKQYNDFINRVDSMLDAKRVDQNLNIVAWQGQRLLVEQLPKRTGATKRSFTVLKRKPGEYVITSTSKVALFLEEGTKAHGPVKAKFLYIPLRPGAAVWRKGFKFGQDYILVDRVKGIKALKYLSPTAEKILNVLIDRFLQQVRKVS